LQRILQGKNNHCKEYRPFLGLFLVYLQNCTTF